MHMVPVDRACVYYHVVRSRCLPQQFPATLPNIAAIKIPPPPAGTAAERLTQLRAVLPGHMSVGISGDWAAADVSAPEARRESSGLAAAFLQWHLERGIRSLSLVDRTPDPQKAR